jgi:hypothetical protein
MLELAGHIVDTKIGDFEPARFEDQYEGAVRELLKRKQEGQKIEVPEERAPAKVINLMDALRRSVEAERAAEGRKAPADSVQHRVARRSRPGRAVGIRGQDNEHCSARTAAVNLSKLWTRMKRSAPRRRSISRRSASAWNIHGCVRR